MSNWEKVRWWIYAMKKRSGMVVILTKRENVNIIQVLILCVSFGNQPICQPKEEPISSTTTLNTSQIIICRHCGLDKASPQKLKNENRR